MIIGKRTKDKGCTMNFIYDFTLSANTVTLDIYIPTHISFFFQCT